MVLPAWENGLWVPFGLGNGGRENQSPYLKRGSFLKRFAFEAGLVVISQGVDGSISFSSEAISMPGPVSSSCVIVIVRPCLKILICPP